MVTIVESMAVLHLVERCTIQFVLNKTIEIYISLYQEICHFVDLPFVKSVSLVLSIDQMNVILDCFC